MSALFVARGECRLGVIKKDAAGNVTEQTGATFTTDPAGGCVMVCEVDPDTMETKEASGRIYGDWEASGFLKDIMERLGPSRPSNVPDFHQIARRAKEEDGVELYETICEYCGRCGYDCRDCIVTRWKEDDEENV